MLKPSTAGEGRHASDAADVHRMLTAARGPAPRADPFDTSQSRVSTAQRSMRRAASVIARSWAADRIDGLRSSVLVTAALVFAGYYVGARIGLALTFAPSPISVLWPPNAILFAALLIVPRDRSWIVIAAALPAHLLAELQSQVPLAMVMSWFASNVTEALIGTAITRWLMQGR